MKFPDVCLGCRIPAAPEEGRWPPKWTPSEDRCRNPCYFMQFHEAESGWQIRTVLAAQFAIVFTTSTCTDALNSNPVLALISANCFVAKESWGLLIPLQSPFCLELTSYLLRKGTIKRRKRGSGLYGRHHLKCDADKRKKIARGDFAHYSCVRRLSGRSSVRPRVSRPFLPLPLFSRPLSCHKLLLPNREQAVPPFNIIASKPKAEGCDIIALATAPWCLCKDITLTSPFDVAHQM